MHLRVPQNTLNFSCSNFWANWKPPASAEAAKGGCALGQLLSTSKMAPAGQESKKHDLKWIFPFAALRTLAADPNPLTWHVHASHML